MKLNKTRFLRYFFTIGMGVLIAYFISSRSAQSTKTYAIRDWQEIEAQGELEVLTSYNQVDYFIQGDSLAGFQYELLHALFKDKNIKLSITPSIDLSQQIKDIQSGKYDLLATNLIVTSELKEQIAVTTPIVKNKQVLVQRKDSVTLADSIYIDNHLQLAKKKLYVIQNSPAILRIKNLSNEIADTIYIEELEKYGEEQLLALVVHGDIDYAVCDEQIALQVIRNHPELDMSLDISFTQFYSWGVNPQSKQLLDSLNQWIQEFVQTKEYLALYQKYYS